MALVVPRYRSLHSLLSVGASSARAEFRWVWVLAMFVLAMVYVPINQTAWGIYIYIAASIPEIV